MEVIWRSKTHVESRDDCRYGKPHRRDGPRPRLPRKADGITVSPSKDRRSHISVSRGGKRAPQSRSPRTGSAAERGVSVTWSSSRAKEHFSLITTSRPLFQPVCVHSQRGSRRAPALRITTRPAPPLPHDPLAAPGLPQRYHHVLLIPRAAGTFNAGRADSVWVFGQAAWGIRRRPRSVGDHRLPPISETR